MFFQQCPELVLGNHLPNMLPASAWSQIAWSGSSHLLAVHPWMAWRLSESLFDRNGTDCAPVRRNSLTQSFCYPPRGFAFDHSSDVAAPSPPSCGDCDILSWDLRMAYQSVAPLCRPLLERRELLVFPQLQAQGASRRSDLHRSH